MPVDEKYIKWRADLLIKVLGLEASTPHRRLIEDTITVAMMYQATQTQDSILARPRELQQNSIQRLEANTMPMDPDVVEKEWMH